MESSEVMMTFLTEIHARAPLPTSQVIKGVRVYFLQGESEDVY